MGCSGSSSASTTVSIHELYSFNEKLGQGSFGQVRACEHRHTKRECAVKIINVEGDSARTAEAAKEGKLWKKAGGHRNIVNLLESYSDSKFSYFVMEKCKRSLCDTLLKKPGVLEEDLLGNFRQMLLALEHCHACSVIHRDVKPANFLVASDGTVKLCDFGLAEVEKPKGVVGMSGTAPFMSPEMVLERPYNCKTDVWSLGATAFLMLYGRYLYQIDKLSNPKRKASELMHRAIAHNSPPPRFVAGKDLPEPSTRARSFVQALLVRDSKSRPTASDCLQLPSMAPEAEMATRKHHTLTSAVKLARQTTAEFKAPVDPTVQKTMDELLSELQKKFRGSLPFRESFSLPDSGEKSLGPVDMRWVPSMSHDGAVSHRVASLGDDVVSECSTTASSSVGTTPTCNLRAAGVAQEKRIHTN